MGGTAWANWQHRELPCREALARRSESYRNANPLRAERLVPAGLEAALPRYCT